MEPWATHSVVICVPRDLRKKVRLDLTVRRDFKKKAAELAERRRRSISGLFEDLIEEEARRVEEKNAAEARSPLV
jgi:hypothetical protein